ncbi:hypothetical protein [Sphingomonas sp. 3P27F8]|uniref:hypothetical protein n=1 Tax=Sphingomonas sp. 3P27F8 TaxID=2502213 RepID=UPI0010F94F2A|nr:hypothetical protein [Sphingomonas sp. 3P27F8]
MEAIDAERQDGPIVKPAGCKSGYDGQSLRWICERRGAYRSTAVVRRASERHDHFHGLTSALHQQIESVTLALR